MRDAYIHTDVTSKLVKVDSEMLKLDISVKILITIFFAITNTFLPFFLQGNKKIYFYVASSRN